MKKIFALVFTTLILASCGTGSSSKSTKNSNLDYSQPGNPPEVALKEEEYLPGDELYEEGHPDYYKEGIPYMTAEIETGVRELWSRPILSVMVEKMDFPANSFDLKNVIVVNETTKLKDFSLNWERVNHFLLASNHPEARLEDRKYYQLLTPEERTQFLEFFDKFFKLNSDYVNTNSAAYDRTPHTFDELWDL